MEFVFERKGRRYIVIKGNNAFSHVVLEDTREVLLIASWLECYPPVIGELEPVVHDYQESLAEELALIFNAQIARTAELEDKELENKEYE